MDSLGLILLGEVHGWNKTANPDDTGLGDCYISALHQDGNGRIYIGTNNGGLYVLDSAHGKIRPLELKRMHLVLYVASPGIMPDSCGSALQKDF